MSKSGVSHKSTTTKKLISVRYDHDIIAWFKARHPTGYQTAMNTALRSHMMNTEARKG